MPNAKFILCFADTLFLSDLTGLAFHSCTVHSYLLTVQPKHMATTAVPPGNFNLLPSRRAKLLTSLPFPSGLPVK